MFTKNLLAALCATFCCGLASAEGAAHWSYGGQTGPANWAELSHDFETCKLGKTQSPLDIVTKAVEKSQAGAIQTGYKASPAELVNNGHTIQVNLGDGGGSKLAGQDYQILQFHFHTPSEEKINGKAFPLNIHLVHKSADGKLGVVGVFVKEGKENAALKDIFAMLPAEEGKAPLKASFDAGSLLPASLAYYQYTGSLTTPPCSENVSFFILKTPVEMSKGQIAAFKKVFAMNARNVQPLNGRKIVEFN